MSSTPEQLLSNYKSNIESAIALSQTAFSGIEKFIDLQLKVGRATLEELTAKSQEALELKDPQDAVAFASSLAQPNAEKAIAYGRHIYDIIAAIQAEFTKAGEAQIAQTQRKISEFVDNFSKNAPAGSESAIALLKSTVAASNSTYDSISKAAKQVADIAESNIAAAAKAGFKASAAANDAAKAAARNSKKVA